MAIDDGKKLLKKPLGSQVTTASGGTVTTAASGATRTAATTGGAGARRGSSVFSPGRGGVG